MSKKIGWGFLYWSLVYMLISAIILSIVGKEHQESLFAISMIIAIPVAFFLTKRKMKKEKEKEEKINQLKEKIKNSITVNPADLDNEKKLKTSAILTLHKKALDENWTEFYDILNILKDLKIQTEDIGKEVYKQTVEKVIKDGELSEKEKEILLKIKDAFNISDKDAKKIYSDIVGNFVKEELQKVFEDKMITDEEKEHIERITKGLNVELDEETKKLIEHLHEIYQTIKESLTPIPCPINLQKDEECYFEIPHAELRKWKKERVSYGGIGISFRVAKGVRLYTGTGRGSFSEDVLTTEDKGSIYITNKRFIFVGKKKTQSIKLDKILDFSIYENSYRDEVFIEIKKDTGPTLVFNLISPVNYFKLSAILNKIMRG